MTRVVAPFVLVVSLLAGVVSTAGPDLISVIKPNRSGDTAARLGVPTGTRWSATNVALQSLVAAAYGSTLPLRDDRIVGLPAWARSERFDIQVRVDAEGLPEEPEGDEAVFAAFAVVRTILAERFALRAHEVFEDAPIYALRRTGTATPRLRSTAIDCDAILRAGPFAEVLGPDGRPLGPCGVRTRAGQIIGSGATLRQLATHLTRVRGVERDVVDRTGLDGRFDFAIQWTPPQAVSPGADDVAPLTGSGPSIFTALQEQVALKLESTRAPVRLLVVDRVARPTPN
jgi:uncharacterized protein (TIGR03435 family)